MSNSRPISFLQTLCEIVEIPDMDDTIPPPTLVDGELRLTRAQYGKLADFRQAARRKQSFGDALMSGLRDLGMAEEDVAKLAKDTRVVFTDVAPSGPKPAND